MNRNYSIDLLRVASSIAVILIHIVSAPIVNSSSVIDSSIIGALKLIHILMMWSVPVFFMITGYCMLKKSECTYKYCFKQVLKYVCVLFTVGFFYSLLEEVFSTSCINISTIKNSLFNVISGNLWDHMWFVYSIIGVYLGMPVLHRFIRESEKDAFVFLILLFFFTIISPSFSSVITVGIDFPFSGYLFYVCFGGFIAKYNVRNDVSFFGFLAGVCSVFWIIVCGDGYSLEYSSLPISLVSMAVFLFVSQLKIGNNNLILLLSSCTWGVYLIHPFFINLAIKFFNIDFLVDFSFVKLFLFFVVVSLLSFMVTYVLKKIPYIKNLF